MDKTVLNYFTGFKNIKTAQADVGFEDEHTTLDELIEELNPILQRAKFEVLSPRSEAIANIMKEALS